MSDMNAKIKAEQTNKMEAAQKILDAGKEASNDDLTPSLPEIIEDLSMKVKTKDGVKTIQELYDGHLMQSDYTKKTTALKEKEGQISKELGEYQDYAAAVQTYFTDKPEAYQNFVDYYQNSDGSAPVKQEKGQATTVRNAEYDRLINDNQKAVKSIQQQLEESQRITRVNTAIAKVQTDNNLDEKEIKMVLKVANGDYDDKLSEYDNLNNAYASVRELIEEQFKDNQAKELVKNQDKMNSSFFGGSTKSSSNVKSTQDMVKEALSSVSSQGESIL